MTIAGKAVLVTGASRGIGRALVDEATLMSARVADAWRAGPAKTLERENAAFVPARPAAA
jgi:NAD(P)-dependent dehydrogenase (short-subunit alcohol dehydrogenase family)